MSRPLSRVQPVGPPEAYKTYQVSTPATHMRPATCAEVECPNHLLGWETFVPAGNERAHFLIRTSGRRYIAEPPNAAGVTRYVFEAGQACFKAPTHRVQVRPELYVVRGGDWRGNPRGTVRRHVRPADWVEDFAEHLDDIATEARKG